MKKQFVFFAVVFLQICSYSQTEISSLSMNDAIELGMKHNQEIKSAAGNISAAKGKYWSGISLPSPEVGVSYEYVPVNSGLRNFGERNIEVSQSFEFPSNYFLKGSKFNKEETIAVYNFNFIRQHVVSKIKTAYCKVLTKKYQLNFAKENLDISEDFFKKAEIRYIVGEGSNLEQLTAKVQYTEAINNFGIAGNELSKAYSQLNFIIGLDSKNFGINYQLTDSLIFSDHQINFAAISQSLEEVSPQIKIAKLKSEIASVEKSLAWSSLLPNFNLAYSKQTLDGDNGYYGASFGVSVPLWFMFNQKGKIQEAAANQSISESEFQLTKDEIVLNVKNAFIDHENNLKQVKFYLSELLPLAEEIYRSAKNSYDAGELTYLEYLQAKQTLINSRNNYINALFNHYQSDFVLEELTGQNNFDNTVSEN